MVIAKSLPFFVAAGLCEIGGGYLSVDKIGPFKFNILGGFVALTRSLHHHV